jgi:hypothetical protein
MKIIGNSTEIHALLNIIECPCPDDECPHLKVDCWECISEKYNLKIVREVTD